MYRLEIHRRVRKKLAELARSVPRDYSRIEAAIDGLAHDPRPTGAKRLQSKARGFRLRIGEYRVLYAVFDVEQIVHVVSVGRRGERTYDDIERLLGD